MTYAQALKLKQNGYPQIAKEISRFSAVKDDGTSGEEVFYPTLKELIEACGDDFSNLIKHEDVWFAESQNRMISLSGKDCKDAVYNLWISLNEK